MRRFLLGLLLALMLAGVVVAGNRAPPMYNAQTSTVTLTANFFAGGGSSAPLTSNIRWSQTNASSGPVFVVTPSANGRTCTVSYIGTPPCQIDVTCTFTNKDGTQASVTVTVCFGQAAVDQISLSATG